MNILRKSRKSKIKFDKRRFVLLIFTLIMTTFAWITYTKILLPNLSNHINSWNISIYVDNNKNGVAEEDEIVENKLAPIVIEPFEVYPGMNQDVIEVLIKNNGEIPSIINYDIAGAEVTFLGETYNVVENAAEERLNHPENFYLQKNETDEAGGITSYKLINEESRIPFDFVIEHTQVVDGGAEGYLKVRAVWDASLDESATEEQIDIKNELDSKWGYDITSYALTNPTTSPIQFKIKLNSYGDNRSSRYVLTQDITPENYGDYVDYSIDLNEDGNTKNDWKIFFEDNENIYIIAANYVKNSWINENAMIKSTAGGKTTYGTKFSEVLLTENSIDQVAINKFKATSMISSDNINYKASANLLKTSYWSQFVDSNFADTAIGAASIEMFAKSWNQKYNGDANYSELIQYWDINKQAYTIMIDNIDNVEVKGYSNASLYFPTAPNDGTNAYWLAAPTYKRASESEIKNSNLLVIKKNGYIGFGNCTNIDACGVRPVVKLKSGIFGEVSTNASGQNVWTLSQERIVEEE